MPQYLVAIQHPNNYDPSLEGEAMIRDIGALNEERAFTGKASCSALSSWRLTTSGSALDNQARRLSSRLLMLLMLKVATLTKSLSVPVLLGASQKEQPSSLFQLALFYRWKK